MNVFELMAKIGLDDSEYVKGLKSAGGMIKNFGSSVTKIGSTLTKVTGIALTAASGAMTAFGKSAIDAGMSFDQSMSQVAATMGKTVDEISELRDFAQEMGATTAFSATEAADALNYMALAGYDAETSMKMLPNVLNLAAAGGMELATASDMITDSQSALGLSLEDTSKLVDQMSMAASKSNTSVSQLGEAILTVGGTAKNLKGGTTELATILGMLADNGVKGAEGGTALRNMLNSLTAPTDDATKMLDNLGVSVFDAEGNMRSLNDIFLDLKKSMNGMSQESKMNVVSTLFNARDMKSAEALLANVGERYEELSGYIDDAKGASEAMAETQLDNLAGDITMFKSALEGAKINISDEMTPALREFVQFGTKGIQELTEAFKNGGLDEAVTVFGNILAEGLNRIIGGLPEFIGAAKTLLGALGQGLLDNSDILVTSFVQVIEILISSVVSAVPTLLTAASELVTQLASLISEQAPVLIDAVIAVINSLVDTFTDPEMLDTLTQAAITLITKYYSAITDPKLLKKLGQAAIQIIKQLGEGLISNADAIIQRAVELINMLIEGVTENLPMILDLVVRVVLAFAEALTQALPTLIPAIVQAVITIVQTLLDPANISMLVDAAIQLVKGLADGLIAAVPLLIDALPEIIQALLTAILEALPQLFAMGIELMVQLSMGLIAAIPDLVKMIPQLIAAIVLALKDGAVAMVESGQELIDNLLSAFTDNPILNSFEEWWEELSAWWEETLAKVFDWGVDLLETFEDGVRSVMGSDWVDFWEEVGGDIYDYLHFSQPDKGPLSGPNGFKSFGPDLVKTFVEGVKSNEHLLEDEMSNLMGTVDTAMGEPIGTTGINGVPIGTGNLNQNAQSGQTIVIQIDGETFGKFVYKYGQAESVRVGAKLTEG